MRVYLDHAATTPMRPEAVAAMLPYLTERYGNPSGSHSMAREARLALDDARESIAGDLGCGPGEIVLTSGGTESDNLAVLGGHIAKGGTVVCSAIEHHAVFRACERVGAVKVPVDSTGKLDFAALQDVLDPGVGLVSVMTANNEVGSIQPIAAVAEVVRSEAPGALFHTDAVAAVGWLDVPRVTAEADLVSVSAHKFGGPKGVGALVVRKDARVAPLFHGGEQEHGRRAGTQHVAGAVGMAAALAAACSERVKQVDRVAALRDKLADGVLGSVTGSRESAIAPYLAGQRVREAKLAPSFHVRFEGVEAEELLVLLDDAGIYASAGAACASGAIEPSHVLSAMGMTSSEARSAVRFSLGVTTTGTEIDYVLGVLPKLVEQLRA